MTLLAGERAAEARPAGPAEASRIEQAIALTPAQRRETLEAFFRANPGIGEGLLGLGRAVLDFQNWEVTSGRIGELAGSPWWRAVNGMMVLDVRAAMTESGVTTKPVEAWRAYASGAGTQAKLWDAHQLSLHSGIAACPDLLEREPEAEQAFAAIVVDVVDRTALAGRPTDTGDLAALTARFYPKCYPVEDDALAGLEYMRGQTAARLCNSDGVAFDNVGLKSSR